MFTHKTYRLLAIILALFFTFSLSATNKVVPCGDESEEIPELAAETIALIGTFAEREFFILAWLHKNLEERKIIEASDYGKRKLKFLKKIQTQKEYKEYKKRKEELRLKQAFLYPKCALRTCLCGTELLVKTPIWTTLFASQAVKSVCILSSMCIVGCVSCPCERSVEEAAACGEWCSKLLCYSSDSDGEVCSPTYLSDECWKVRFSCDDLRQDKIDIAYLVYTTERIQRQRMERH